MLANFWFLRYFKWGCGTVCSTAVLKCKRGGATRNEAFFSKRSKRNEEQRLFERGEHTEDDNISFYKALFVVLNSIFERLVKMPGGVVTWQRWRK